MGRPRLTEKKKKKKGAEKERAGSYILLQNIPNQNSAQGTNNYQRTRTVLSKS